MRRFFRESYGIFVILIVLALILTPRKPVMKINWLLVFNSAAAALNLVAAIFSFAVGSYALGFLNLSWMAILLWQMLTYPTLLGKK